MNLHFTTKAPIGIDTVEVYRKNSLHTRNLVILKASEKMAEIYKDIKLIFNKNIEKFTLLSRETFSAEVESNTD